MSRALVVLCLFAVGCGSNFAGTYKGPITSNTTCNGQTNISQSDVTMVLTQKGDAVQVGATNCPALSGTADGDVVTLQQTTCPTRVVDGASFTGTFTSGTLTLSGDTLSLKATLNATITQDGSTTDCSVEQSGVLTRSE